LLPPSGERSLLRRGGIVNNLFNNREISTLFWLSVLAVWALRQEHLRQSFARIPKAFWKWRIVVLTLFLMLYVAACAYGMNRIGLWNPSHLKGTLLWFLGSGYVMFVQLLGEERNLGLLREIGFKCFKLILVMEFLIGMYVFSLPVELVFVPFLSLVVMMKAIADTEVEKDYRAVQKLLDGILIIIGFVLVYHTVREAASEPGRLLASKTLKDFALPIWLTLSFLPVLYLGKLAAMYQVLFVRISFLINHDERVQRYVKWKTLLLCRLNVWRLERWGRYLPTKLCFIEDRDDVQNVIRRFGEEKPA